MSGTSALGWVRQVLRCPACGSSLTDVVVAGEPRLTCDDAACARSYPVRDGVPVLLVDESVPASGTV